MILPIVNALRPPQPPAPRPSEGPGRSTTGSISPAGGESNQNRAVVAAGFEAEAGALMGCGEVTSELLVNVDSSSSSEEGDHATWYGDRVRSIRSWGSEPIPSHRHLYDGLILSPGLSFSHK